jgi:uncharacterized membrane protein YtjA (UPF0391 family)
LAHDGTAPSREGAFITGIAAYMGRRGGVFHVRGRPICSCRACEFLASAGRNHRSALEIVSASEARQPRRSQTVIETEVLTMLSWVVTFLVIALIAGILGFGGIAGASIEIAKIIFFIAIVLFLVSAVVGLVRGRTRV